MSLGLCICTSTHRSFWRRLCLCNGQRRIPTALVHTCSNSPSLAADCQSAAALHLKLVLHLQLLLALALLVPAALSAPLSDPFLEGL